MAPDRLKTITMNAFRGVPTEFILDLGHGSSAVIFGDNATGKSTIADAIELFFMGRVELLSHEGRDHAIRHLNAQPGYLTKVAIGTTGTLGGVLTYPADFPRPRRVEDQETFLLRGRTLADFVNKTKSEKWKALAEILGLEDVDQGRLDLQRARNDLRSAAQDAKRSATSAVSALGYSSFSTPSRDDLLARLVEKCREAAVNQPATLDQALAPGWAVELSVTGAEQRDLQLGHIVGDLEQVRANSVSVLQAIEAWNHLINEIPQSAAANLRLHEAGARYLELQTSVTLCPLCGQSVSHQHLAVLIAAELARLRKEHEGFQQVERKLIDEVERADDLVRHRRSIVTRAGESGIALSALPSIPIQDWRRSIQRGEAIDSQAFLGLEHELTAWDAAAAGVLEEARRGLNTTRERVLVEIGELISKIKSWDGAVSESARAETALAMAERVFGAYQDAQLAFVQAVLDRISSEVAAIYEFLHPNEHLQGVRVETWTEKGLELAVDFYGIHQRPPHGVLSESHLNSLAIALFLAMAKTFNRQVGFLVLDDVVNSLDMDHRGQLAELLTTRFTDWQLIVLTHDYQFYRGLGMRVPSWKKYEFTSWTYEFGPRMLGYASGSMIEKARGALVDDDRQGAASKGRRGLEELLQEICEALEAPLPFRRGTRNDLRDATELIHGVRRAIRSFAQPLKGRIEQSTGDLLNNLEADLQVAFNTEVHAGRGAASRQEIENALERVEELEACWTCGSCHLRGWHNIGNPSILCQCGSARLQ